MYLKIELGLFHSCGVIRLVFRPLVTMAGSTTVKGGMYKGGPLAHLERLASFKFNRDFTPITVGPEMEPLPESVMSDLSTDQQYGYRLYRMIRTGICPIKGDSCSNCHNSSKIHHSQLELQTNLHKYY